MRSTSSLTRYNVARHSYRIRLHVDISACRILDPGFVLREELWWIHQIFCGTNIDIAERYENHFECVVSQLWRELRER